MLSYSEKLLFVLYKELYGKDYTCNKNNKLPDGIVAEHLMAQKSTYLFAQYNIQVDDYDFIWDRRGPFSLALQDRLRLLDDRKKEVEEFYSLYNSDKESYINQLLTEKQIERITKLVIALQKLILDQDDNIEKQCTACELLCSLIYLSRIVLPGRQFDAVNSELCRRKPHLNNNEYNKEVWNILEGASLLSV